MGFITLKGRNQQPTYINKNQIFVIMVNPGTDSIQVNIFRNMDEKPIMFYLSEEEFRDLQEDLQ